MHPDTHYPDPDLIKGHITRKGVKTFHTEALTATLEPELLELGGGWFGITDGTKHQGEAQAHNAGIRASIHGTGVAWCGLEIIELTPAGWARGLIRQDLAEHAECRKAREGFLEALEEASYDLDSATEDTSEAESQ